MSDGRGQIQTFIVEFAEKKRSAPLSGRIEEIGFYLRLEREEESAKAVVYADPKAIEEFGKERFERDLKAIVLRGEIPEKKTKIHDLKRGDAIWRTSDYTVLRTK